MCKMQCVNGSANWTSWTDQLDGPAGQTSWTDQLDGPVGRTSWTDQLEGPVLFIWSLGQFAYLKIFLSVCTLSQLRSLTKVLFYLLYVTCYLIIAILCLFNMQNNLFLLLLLCDSLLFWCNYLFDMLIWLLPPLCVRSLEHINNILSLYYTR